MDAEIGRELVMRATHIAPEMLSAYLDEELARDERARVASHLETCELCRSRLRELGATVGMVHDLDPLLAPEGLRDAVRARLSAAGASRSSSIPSVRSWIPTWRPGWRLTGAALAVMLIGLFAMNLLRSAGPPGLDWRGNEPEGVGGLRAPVITSPRLAAPGPGAAPKVADQIAPSPSGGPLVLRRVIRTGYLFIEVDDFDAAVRRLIVIAEGAGGFVASSSSSQGQGTPQGTFVLRVPAPRFAPTLTALEDLGRVRERRVGGQDVSEEFVDLQARVRNLERHEQRLLTFMDRATKVSDLLAIEQELARVRGEIEALTGRLRVLGNQVELATIEAAMRQKPDKVSHGFWDVGATVDRVLAAFLNTVRQILVAVEGAAVVLSALLPVLLLGGLAWVLLRRLRSRMV
jgi:hypothetical protein